MLVYTDIEDSTKAAAEAPAAMIVVQEVHDRVMRQGIQRFAGYEIHTQGDAFEVAFATAVSAVQFCLWTQDQLKIAEWPKLVLRVPEFAETFDESGDVVMRGPRVRMGVHAARPGTWLKGTHGYTHHTVFGGEGVDLIATVSDAGGATGGRVTVERRAEGRRGGGRGGDGEGKGRGVTCQLRFTHPATTTTSTATSIST